METNLVVIAAVVYLAVILSVSEALPPPRKYESSKFWYMYRKRGLGDGSREWGTQWRVCVPHNNPKHMHKYTEVEVPPTQGKHTQLSSLAWLYYYPIKSLADANPSEYVCDTHSLLTGYPCPRHQLSILDFTVDGVYTLQWLCSTCLVASGPAVTWHSLMDAGTQVTQLTPLPIQTRTFFCKPIF